MTFSPLCAIINKRVIFKPSDFKRNGVIKIEYEVHENDSNRELIITGINFPRTAGFDPLAKIWASVRKRCKEEYGVDVIAVFFYDDVGHKVLCKFYLNYGECDVTIKTYRKRYRRNFAKIIAKFANVVALFMANMNNSYTKYYELWEKGEDISEYNECLNQFLKSAGLRTPSDERLSAERSEKLEQAKKTVRKKILPGA